MVLAYSLITGAYFGGLALGSPFGSGKNVMKREKVVIRGRDRAGPNVKYFCYRYTRAGRPFHISKYAPDLYVLLSAIAD